MAAEQPCGALGKVSTVFATKLKSFTFLPVWKKLPAKGRVITTREEESRRDTAFGDPAGFEGNMEDEGVYKAKVVYLRDSNDMEPEMISKHDDDKLKPTDKSALSLSPTPTMDHAEISCPSPNPNPVTTETSHNKHPGIPQLRCHNTSGTEDNSGPFLNSMSQRDEGILSPASSMDIFISPASSKESLLSEGWEREKNWSTLRMLSPMSSPLPFSSPCSSVRSGSFSPSVVRIKRHALASGSSLVQMPHPSNQKVCCDGQATLPCPLSAHDRHRPPPTQLSLLTAILRKGRLPVLSASLQRPYSPCWPISPASMTSCVACSAASKVASMEGSLAKPCTFYDRGCHDSSLSGKPEFISDTVSMSPKMHNNVGISTTQSVEALNSSESNSFSRPEICSRDISSSHDSSYREVHKEACVPTVASSLIFSSFSRARALSPKSSHLSCCSSERQMCTPVSCDHSVLLASDHSNQSQDSFSAGPERDSTHLVNKAKLSHAPSSTLKYGQMPHDPFPIPYQLSQDIPPSAFSYVNNNSSSHSQNLKKLSPNQERIILVSPDFRPCPSLKDTGLTRLAYNPSASPVCPSPRPSSCSPTSDCCTLSPSPAISSRQLSPSPSYSLCSSPSPSLRASTPENTVRGDKSRKPYKIKSTYKALAAIPTNTLLQEQQAIDDEVERNEASLDPNDPWEDRQSQVCTPAQLRQQSAELYAVIDEVLEDTNQTCQSSPANKLTVISTSETPRKLTSSPSPRSLGRETKYAIFPLQPPGSTENTMTRPGVIRPVTVTKRLVDDKVEEYFTNPFERHQDSASDRY